MDDILAVLVIALFYTSDVSWGALGIGAVFLVALVAANLAGVGKPLPYALLGIGLWLCFLESGVHATIAGVLVAMTVPASAFIDTGGSSSGAGASWIASSRPGNGEEIPC